MREMNFGCFPSKNCLAEMDETESNCENSAGEGAEGPVLKNLIFLKFILKICRTLYEPKKVISAGMAAIKTPKINFKINSYKNICTDFSP